VGKTARRPSPHSPLTEALRLQERLSRLLERALEASVGTPRSAAAAPFPAVDLIETPAAFVLSADLPGLVPASLELAIAPRVLALSGRLRGTLARPRAFRRRIALPAEVEPGSARGSLRHGVLRLRVPKRLRLVAKAPRRGTGRT
jgi:HSP20 family protein